MNMNSAARGASICAVCSWDTWHAWWLAGSTSERASTEMAVLAVIPARFASTRLPGKPLLPVLSGEPMIAHVVRAALAASSVRRVLVATDHAGIAKAAEAAGAESVMTDSAISTGTDRVAAALRLRADASAAADVVVNVQGDEPLVQPAAIDLAARLLLSNTTADMATLSAPLPSSEALLDPSKVKVVCGPLLAPALSSSDTGSHETGSHMAEVGACRRALFFSRAPIGIERDALHSLLHPSARDGGVRATPPPLPCAARLHVGLYAFRPSSLERFVSLPPSPLERVEQLEQMRALEAGMSILVGEVDHASRGIDTIEDVRELSRLWNEASVDVRTALLGGSSGGYGHVGGAPRSAVRTDGPCGESDR